MYIYIHYFLTVVSGWRWKRWFTRPPWSWRPPSKTLIWNGVHTHYKHHGGLWLYGRCGRVSKACCFSFRVYQDCTDPRYRREIWCFITTLRYNRRAWDWTQVYLCITAFSVDNQPPCSCRGSHQQCLECFISSLLLDTPVAGTSPIPIVMAKRKLLNIKPYVINLCC